MKSSDDMIADLYERRDRYETDKKRKQAVRRRIAIPAIVVCLVMLLGAGVWKSGVLGKLGKRPASPAGNETQENVSNKPTSTPLPPEVTKSKDLTAGAGSGVAANRKPMDLAMREAYEQFAYRLFTQLPEGETRMVSPFSVYVALSIAANGANGETLSQMDELLGLTAEERNAYLTAWIDDLTSGGSDDTRFTNADSLWIRSSLEQYVPKEFLDICAQYYQAAVYSTPMDRSTVEGINAWVKAKTMNMIDKLIEELSPETVMILMNAIALDAKWTETFDEAKTQKDYTFTKADGSTVKVDMMFEEAQGGYVENDLATGFIKRYKGGEFSYIALLPKEGVSVGQLAKSLKPGDIRILYNNPINGEVNIGLPKYEEEYKVELNEVLKALGVTDAFDAGKADFSRLLQRSAYVSQVTHKTFISVDEAGTKAAAVTEIAFDECATRRYHVILDRPFVYMIVDSDGLPIFLGTYEG